jgi:ADP-ribosylglycohydrolase
MDLNDRFRGCLIGLAVGDAVGTSLEFKARGSFKPINDMAGGGPSNLRPGEWTDDTSMALCLVGSLIECNGFDANDQIMKYIKWREEGYYMVILNASQLSRHLTRFPLAYTFSIFLFIRFFKVYNSYKKSSFSTSNS